MVRDPRDKPMRVLKLRDLPPRDPDYVFNDTQHIVKALYDAGYVVTYRAAKMAWEQYSADTCAGWLTLPGSGDSDRAEGDAMIVELMLHGQEGGVTLNGRKDGPYLVDSVTGEEVEPKRVWPVEEDVNEEI